MTGPRQGRPCQHSEFEDCLICLSNGTAMSSLMACPKCGYSAEREPSTVTYYCPPCSREGRGVSALIEVCPECKHPAKEHTTAESDYPRESIPYCEGGEDCACTYFWRPRMAEEGRL